MLIIFLIRYAVTYNNSFSNTELNVTSNSNGHRCQATGKNKSTRNSCYCCCGENDPELNLDIAQPCSYHVYMYMYDAPKLLALVCVCSENQILKKKI